MLRRHDICVPIRSRHIKNDDKPFILRRKMYSAEGKRTPWFRRFDGQCCLMSGCLSAYSINLEMNYSTFPLCMAFFSPFSFGCIVLGYAIPAVNCVSSSGINACLEAARKNDAPIIIQFSSGGSQVCFPSCLLGCPLC